MHFAVGNVNERGDVAAQINLGVHLHRSLGGAEMRPRKDAQRKIDGRRVERIDRVGEINPEILISVKLAGRWWLIPLTQVRLYIVAMPV
jgi:hypothetical protein